MAPRTPRYEKVAQLIERGAAISNPSTVDIGEEVQLDRISPEITVFPGCRIYGAGTVISAGARLGAEAPVTVEDCCLGPSVELKGGYFKRSVFLERSSMGSGAQVREDCLIEEEASGAHCVGLKQTILFPFVTLGSLVNFCDCLMAGGTSRREHSEVGSSYIHFNYTPAGDKATPSLFGDVPRGVMLNCPPIFLGGQGGAVGPVRLGFGTVVAAGCILRRDVLEDGRFVSAAPSPDFVREHRPYVRKNLNRIVRNNLVYLANLVALEEWYKRVRRPFFGRQDMGDLVYAGAMGVLARAKEERANRFLMIAEQASVDTEEGRQLRDQAESVCRLVSSVPLSSVATGEAFAVAVASAEKIEGLGYVDAVRQLPESLAAAGVRWLTGIVDGLLAGAGRLLPAFEL
jgi:UDP-N-acetylglucosamine/UDP-N-acetylgalactosamine diphosphorylase